MLCFSLVLQAETKIVACETLWQLVEIGDVPVLENEWALLQSLSYNPLIGATAPNIVQMDK